ncbi:phosphatidylserine/phosphatidylglycerophosphate/cardiolipin synthase family protein [Bdellovibrio sp. ZAP7]|uniref:phospholipase D-like domain-containing protein n=1 Tax=Bdellovibrio sp. ZAP7 TaxID=2231053 RepID=UPI00115B01FC|nr:phosphatidylserine/phosphatidylglycerophosphate/cardiolipin synthase family protein [Bdellovibrio sp. ZAP7]QDK45960.1 phosphatidylserine/phosphatidylglycerophosphate/cardiolipin synthase family protein [Bdellovibrio sp. ZAP7]
MDSWSAVKLFHNGDAYFESLIQDIQNAKESITIESYIFDLDKLTENILSELSHAVKRGVSVKLILDGFGSYYSIPPVLRYCQQHGIELRVFHIMPYPSSWLHRLPAFETISKASWWRRMNRRNHRKVIIFDEKTAYLGSLNFTQVHCAKYVGNKAWRDTGVRVQGPAVRQLVIATQITYLRTIYKGFLSWISRWRAPSSPLSSAVQLNTTQKMRKHLYRDMLRKISHAKHRVYITTAYFLPKRSVMRVLMQAKERGADVRLLIPGKSDVPFSKWASFFLVRFLIQKGIPVFEYQKSILHAKTMVIDDEVYVGSFNLNYRSLFHDLEVIAHFKDQDTLENMLTQWNEDCENSQNIAETSLGARSWFLRVLYKIAFRLRYML